MGIRGARLPLVGGFSNDVQVSVLNGISCAALKFGDIVVLKGDHDVIAAIDQPALAILDNCRYAVEHLVGVIVRKGNDNLVFLVDIPVLAVFFDTDNALGKTAGSFVHAGDHQFAAFIDKAGQIILIHYGSQPIIERIAVCKGPTGEVNHRVALAVQITFCGVSYVPVIIRHVLSPGDQSFAVPG